MKRIATLLGVVLVVASVSIGAIACSDDDDNGGGDGTPQATEPVDETPSGGETPSATEADGTPAAATSVEVNLTEYTVAPDPAAVPPGPVTFTAMNIGGTVHELVVIRTGLAPESLPTADDGSVDEDGEGMELIGEVEDVEAGAEGELTVDLEAGSYALICNVVEENEDGSTIIHYAEGMYSAFAVE